MTNKTDAQLIAEAIAAGKLKKVPEGENSGMTTRDWYKAVRAETPKKDTSPKVLLGPVDHLGRQWYKNDEGEVIGHD